MTVTGAETDRATTELGRPPAIGPDPDDVEPRDGQAAALEEVEEIDDVDDLHDLGDLDDLEEAGELDEIGESDEVGDGFESSIWLDEPDDDGDGPDESFEDEVDDLVELEGEGIRVEDWLDQAAVLHEELSRQPEVDDGFAPFAWADHDAGWPGNGNGRGAVEVPAGPTLDSTDDPPEAGFEHARAVDTAALPLATALVEVEEDVEVLGAVTDAEPTTSSGEPTTDPEPSTADPAAARRARRRFLFGASLFFVLLTANGAAAGYLISLFVPERWTAEAEVVFDTGIDQIDTHLDTRKVLMESSLVLDRALVDLAIDRDEVEDRLDVFPIEASSALGINFTDEDPDLALAVVSAVVEAFTEEVDAEEVDISGPIYEARIEELVERRTTLEQELVRLETANATAEALEQAPPYPAEVRRMTLESEQLLSRIEALEESVLTEEISAAERADVQVVTAARLLSEPSWPKPLAFTALGMLVGSIVAAVVLFLVASRRAA